MPLDAADMRDLCDLFRKLLAEESAQSGRGGGVAPLMTVREVADFLRTTPKAIYHRVERGQLPGIVHDGDRILVRRADLVRYLAEGRGLSPTRSR